MGNEPAWMRQDSHAVLGRHVEGLAVRPLFALDGNFINLERAPDVRLTERSLLRALGGLRVARQEERPGRRQQLIQHISVRLENPLDQVIRIGNEIGWQPSLLAEAVLGLGGLVFEYLDGAGVAEVLLEET